MNRYVFHIIISIVAILISIFGIYYGIWEMNRPRTGAVGNGPQPITFRDLLSPISGIVVGLLSVIVAIINYVDKKCTKEDVEEG